MNKFIELFPGDIVTKYCKILNENNGGILIEVLLVKNNNGYSNYKEGEIYFISYSANLIYRVLKNDEIEKLKLKERTKEIF